MITTRDEMQQYQDAWSDDEQGPIEKAVRATGVAPKPGTLPVVPEKDEDEPA